MKIYNSKGKIKKVIIKAYYNLGGDYILFEDNPLHNSTYENVEVSIEETVRIIAGIEFLVNEICIEGNDPINCELVGYQKAEDTLLIKICQDWG